MSEQQHPHPGVPPDLFNKMTFIFPDTGDVRRVMYQYYAAPGQPEKTVYLPYAIVQTGGEPLLPPDFPGGIQKMNWSDDESD